MTIPEQAKRPLLTRIISLEGAMAAFGLYSLITGLMDDQALHVFWGIMILSGLGILTVVRRRDWKKHWEEMEAIEEVRLKAKAKERTGNSQGEE